MKAYEELFGGYREEPNEALARVFNEVEGYADIVLVRDIPFYSHCEHHIAPFFGKAHVGYYPATARLGFPSWRASSTFSRVGCRRRRR